MSIGEHIKRIREENNLSAKQMAEMIGVNVDRLRKWESNGLNPKEEDAGKIEDFFGVMITELEQISKIKYNSKKIPFSILKENATEYQISPTPTYTETRRIQKQQDKKDNTISYYEIGASAGTAHSAEILPVKKTDAALKISDLFKGSEYAIRISGNSMTPNYPSGAIIGIRQIEDKVITPGSVYVVEKGNDLWIKRLYYKEDNQETGIFQCTSDNTMKQESGPRAGKFYYPSFEIEINKVSKLFKVTGTYKSNELNVIGN